MYNGYGIYKITSPSGKVYIGQSHCIDRRFRIYRQPTGAKGQPKLKSSFLKYGVANHLFEVIYQLPSDVKQEVLDSYEIFCIEQYKECGTNMLNTREGGSRGKNSPETRKKISLKTKGGKKHTEAWKQKMRERPNPGRPHTEEAKKKMSEYWTGRNKGVPLSAEHCKSISEGKKGHAVSPETREKIRKTLTGRNKGVPHTEEQKAVTSAAIKLSWQKRKASINEQKQ